MVDWQAVQDGIKITFRMTDDQVWSRCQLFGGHRLARGIERYIEQLDKKIKLDKI
jgi:hypothetical protein